MQAGEVLKILLLILLSSVKFIAGPPFAYSFNQKYEFSFSEAILYSVIGGMLGVFIFTFFSTQVTHLLHYIRQHGKRMMKRGVIFSRPEADVDVPLNIHYTYVEKEKERQKKILSERHKKLLNIWKSYGLAGIAFITPCIISIPIGTIVANALEPNKRKIFAYMFASILFWSIVIHSIFYLKIF